MLIIKKLEIPCPTVTSLNVSGLLERVELKNVSSVVDAVFLFSYNFHGYKKDYLEILRLFMKLHHSKALKICTWCVLSQYDKLNANEEEEEETLSCCLCKPIKCWRHYLKQVELENFDATDERDSLLRFFNENDKLSRRNIG